MDLIQAIWSGLDQPRFTKVQDIVEHNSLGKIWLIGGSVYRTIAHQFYGSPQPKVDWDFIIESPAQNFELPKGWQMETNRYGNLKLKNGEETIDYIPLYNIYSIIQRNIEPTIENYLTGVPLTLQSIAYDVSEQRIIGDIGIDSITKREVKVNNLFFAQYAARKKGQTLSEMIQEKADSLGFAPIFP